MPTLVKVLVWIVVIAAAVVVLFRWVFPWVEERQQDPTIGVVLVQADGPDGPGPGQLVR